MVISKTGPKSDKTLSQDCDASFGSVIRSLYPERQPGHDLLDHVERGNPFLGIPRLSFQRFIVLDRTDGVTILVQLRENGRAREVFIALATRGMVYSPESEFDLTEPHSTKADDFFAERKLIFALARVAMFRELGAKVEAWLTDLKAKRQQVVVRPFS